MKVHRIHFGKQSIKFAIKRTKRKKTMAIFVSLPEGVRVNAPFKMKTKRVYSLIRKKAPWIIKHLNDIKESNYLAIKHEFVSGESFSYLGRHYRLRVKRNNNHSNSIVLIHSGYFDVYITNRIPKERQKNMIRAALVDWYKKHALDKLKERTIIYVRKLAISSVLVLVRDQKKRWGSCSKTGVLRFNWRIAMAPMSVIDYVVVHELCHLKIKNHSADFWKRVSLVVPDYERRRTWLRNNAGVFRL